MASGVSSTRRTTTMLRAALGLANRGLPVFPCQIKGKEPATYHGVKDATTDARTIRGWWGKEPNFNIGLATGAPSKVFVVDVDSEDGEAALSALEVDNDALPATVEVITGRGRHLYFKMPDVPVANSASRIAAGIDVRGTGGYVLAPPSIHPSGRAYAWSVDSGDAFADAPRWLIDKATGRAARLRNGNGNGYVYGDPKEWRDIITGGVDEGRRDDTVARLAGYLLRRHIDPIVTLTLLQSWNASSCRPPLPPADIERICNSVAGRELKRRSSDGD